MTAEQKVMADRAQVISAKQSLAAAQESVASAGESVTVYDAGASYTMLPHSGDVLRRGDALYAINGHPAVLLYGMQPAWRAFHPGMGDGQDVAELNDNLRALGYGDPLGASFTSATAQAVDALQTAIGLPQTGTLPLGSVAFAPGPLRVTEVVPTLGSAVQAGEVLRVTSTRHQVTVQLDASQQADVKAGDRVTVTLPNNTNTAGVVSAVGRVATSSSSSDNSGSNNPPTVEVDIRLLHVRAAGQLDQAPVQVAITTATVRNALVVPVGALLALAGGGYAVETVGATGTHQLVPVELGLFDDADGLVQVRGAGVHAGQHVVVPST